MDGISSFNTATVNFLISIVHFNPILLPRLVGGWALTEYWWPRKCTIALLPSAVFRAMPSVSQPIAMERVYYQTLAAHWPLAGLGLTDNIWAKAMQGRLGTTSSGLFGSQGKSGWSAGLL